MLRKWLTAGVMEEGEVTPTDTATPQGAVASPLLEKICLRYVFDLWAERWRHQHAHGRVVIFVRYADDIACGFEQEADAQRFWAALRQPMEKFALSLHPDKTRLIGRQVAEAFRQ